jgi:hypothetical protein
MMKEMLQHKTVFRLRMVLFVWGAEYSGLSHESIDPGKSQLIHFDKKHQEIKA